MMYEQKLDIQLKLDSTKAKMLRRKAKLIEIEQGLESTDPVKKLNAQADLIEWQSTEGMLEMAVLGAEQELATINSIMAELEPQRKYADLPILEAAQAAQREEWLLEFKRRTENYLLSMGTIPEDHLNAMRNHPDFESQLVPYITNVMNKIGMTKDKTKLLTNNRMLIDG
ncbi:MAG: hypothetical protein EB127_04375 [Alphaproteobacteria bacterium]|nr:hypothetical protein [Alphaproteobacteria bacterium]